MALIGKTLNSRGKELPVRPCGSPTCTPAGILLRAASPLLPKGEASAKGEATGAAQREKQRFYESP
ncbi:hypothetical protein [Nostoc sp.]|uniref:hypothetical protein n=1 Tax=Nostoc sp. TaxID=1180 RepID=UPI002FF42681